MVNTHRNLEAEVTRLETELRLYKELKLSSIERRLNELLDELDNPATPQTKGQRLRERLGIIASTVALTAIVQGQVEIPLEFQQPVRQEQVSKFSPGLAPALDKVEASLAPSTSNSAPKPASKAGEFVAKVKQVAQRIGADPIDLLTLMSFETAGTLSPAKRGPHVPGQGRAVGLIQFMPATAKELKTSVQELAAMSPVEQLDYVEKYLVKRGFRGGGLKQLYSTVFAGHPNARGNISDGYHTLDSAVARMNREHRPRAVAMLSGQKLVSYPEAKAAIASWSPQFQKDSSKGDTVAGFIVTSPKGPRIHPVTGKVSQHNGVDLALPVGTPLYAIADGIIEYGHNSVAGLYGSFTSDSFPGLAFKLVHLSKGLAEPGAKREVKAGEVIGWSGGARNDPNAGRSTGPHLHLGIKGDSGNWLRVRLGWLHWFVTGKKP
jgi:murein DD-endopeptidase MepM/ murein hydrolase activator NlpD